MEITLRPAPMGCLRAVLGILTLGLIPWMLRRTEGRFIRRMDDAGFETRDGRRIAWAEVTRVERAQGRMNGNVLSDELQLTTPKGTVSVPLWRAENAAAAGDYALRHIPAATPRG